MSDFASIAIAIGKGIAKAAGTYGESVANKSKGSDEPSQQPANEGTNGDATAGLNLGGLTGLMSNVAKAIKDPAQMKEISNELNNQGGGAAVAAKAAGALGDKKLASAVSQDKWTGQTVNDFIGSGTSSGAVRSGAVGTDKPTIPTSPIPTLQAAPVVDMGTNLEPSDKNLKTNINPSYTKARSIIAQMRGMK